MGKQIPEGYEFLATRSRQNAGKAIDAAVERGFPASSVLSVSDGYYIPLEGNESIGEEIFGTVQADVPDAEVSEVEIPKETDKVADIEKFASDWNIDLGGAKNNAERIAAIEAEIERRTAQAEQTGVLTDGTDNKEN